jgi:hypothetical protein
VTLDEALDELYAAPLDRFVAERKRLAKELGGEDATTVAALRKPNVAAWILNQLARRHRRDVDLLLDAGHRLRQAGLDKAAVDRARQAESDALKRLAKAAESLGASPQTLTRVNETLRAAAVTEEGRELLARGRFTEPLRASGFEAYAGLDLPKRKPKPRARAKPRVDPELRAAEQRLHALRARLEALEAEVAEAEERVRELGGSG